VVLGFAHVGIACATSICGWLNALCLIGVSWRRGHFRLDARSRRAVPRIIGAAVGMGVVLLALERVLGHALAGPAMLRYASLTGLVGAGLLAFGVLVVGLGGVDWRELRAQMVRPA
jgi:putative peptidoglycan lipid II flippase